MFTLFHLFGLLGLSVGAIAGAVLGWQHSGPFGLVAGGIAGLIAGGVVGQIPYYCALWLLSRKLVAMSTDQLREELHRDDCLTPNLLLLELRSRGEDLACELPFVCALLTSEDMSRRTRGWAALTSAFPNQVPTIPQYNPTDPTARCQQTCQSLVSAVSVSAVSAS